MPTASRNRAARALVLCALVTPACTAPQRMPSPLTTGQVAPNRRQAPAQREEARAGLRPGTLATEASLQSMTAQEVCFDLTLRTTAERAALAEPGGWQIGLRSEPVAAFQPAAVRAARAVTQKKLPSLNSGGQNGSALGTFGTALADVTVLTGGGTVCFASGEALTAVRTLSLELTDAPTSFGQRRALFEFEFEFE